MHVTHAMLRIVRVRDQCLVHERALADGAAMYVDRRLVAHRRVRGPFDRLVARSYHSLVWRFGHRLYLRQLHANGSYTYNPYTFLSRGKTARVDGRVVGFTPYHQSSTELHFELVLPDDDDESLPETVVS